jgi:hypothetical protein
VVSKLLVGAADLGDQRKENTRLSWIDILKWQSFS